MMPYVILEVEDSMVELLKGHLKGAYSEKVIAIGKDERSVPVFDREVLMRDYVTLKSFIDMGVSWGD